MQKLCLFLFLRLLIKSEIATNVRRHTNERIEYRIIHKQCGKHGEYFDFRLSGETTTTHNIDKIAEAHTISK